MVHLGLIGIGVMGSAFALNLSEKGHAVSLLDRSVAKSQAVVEAGREQGLAGSLQACASPEDFVASLPKPRAILVLVPSGKPLDGVIDMLKPLLDAGDLIADLGNSYYRDTEARVEALEAQGLLFLGMGISGGAEGARHGPSIMAGGSKESWARVEGPLKDAAAKFEGVPCCDWFGPGGAGHFIKMLHNGIEYADMQQIAEAYGLMRSGLNMTAPEIGVVFKGWMNGPLNSYLIEIAGEVASAVDPETGNPMLDIILDKAGQKGTGRWSVIEALHLGAPASLMQAAVEARNISAKKQQRIEMAGVFGPPTNPLEHEMVSRPHGLASLEQAMIAAKICAYAQGFEVLRSASDAFGWNLDLAAIARVWRAGCIIRSVLLDEISDAFSNDAETHLALAPVFQQHLKDNSPALQAVVAMGVAHGLDVPALHAAFSYFNAQRTGESTASMIQGLRDFFGAHRFERVDRPGEKVNGPWHG
ncbi:MAG: NADP-dependent phosphogluconate dehydrogenase [Rhodobacteraceae bacterium]|nr:NADP-dependent phosphogluconate dehydrogenase [Paracoccaceae bacterium]